MTEKRVERPTRPRPWSKLRVAITVSHAVKNGEACLIIRRGVDGQGKSPDVCRNFSLKSAPDVLFAIANIANANDNQKHATLEFSPDDYADYMSGKDTYGIAYLQESTDFAHQQSQERH